MMRVPHMKPREWRRDWRNPAERVRQSVDSRIGRPSIYDFAGWARRWAPRREACPVYPGVIHAWDNTPRSGKAGLVFRNPDPAIYRTLLRAALDVVADNPPERRIVFLKSWNEWAEGNHLEPDQRYGLAYLRVVAEVLGA